MPYTDIAFFSQRLILLERFNSHLKETYAMRHLLSAFAAGAILFGGFSAQAAPEKYEFDKAHTQILFFVSHLGYSMSQGEFLDYDGHFVFDEEKPEESSVEVTIQTASIDMDDKKWDEHLKNEDFFNVSEYPEMTFKSTEITQIGADTGKITGDLTLLGVTKPVTLDVTFNKAGPFPMNPDVYKAGFSATGTVKRSEFGMDYGLPGVGDDVEIRIEVEGERTAASIEEEKEAAEEEAADSE
jgi:polyisoprenoid-binding protein YceI